MAEVKERLSLLVYELTNDVVERRCKALKRGQDWRKRRG